MNVNRVILIVLDSVGIGELPDAGLYKDKGANTLGHIAEQYPKLAIPNLIKMGLGNIDPNNALPKTTHPNAAFGKAMEQSAGKDTTTGHWEICGTILEKPFPTFPNGFPKELMNQFEQKIHRTCLGNKTASGTAIINELGDEHVRTKKPIVYTSADSVFQIAMHEDVYPIEQQYAICETARELLVGKYEVSRVIARPFVGKAGNYTRTSRRKDFSVEPPDNILTSIQKAGLEVFGIGKIRDIFSGKGISRYIKTPDNQAGIQATIKAIQSNSKGLIFTNLVDFDMLYGHRRNVEGYAKCLMEFDQQLPNILASLKTNDLLIITADHGNDPSFSGNDHTREYIPILNYGHMLKAGTNIGIRNSFSDIAASIADALNIDFESKGKSYFSEIIYH